MGSGAWDENCQEEKMIKTKDFELASKEEAIWIKARDSTIARIKAVEEALIIDRAFLELCNQKIKLEEEKQNGKT